MEIKHHQGDDYIRKIEQQPHCIFVIWGADYGLVQDRFNMIDKYFTQHISDPFAIIDMNAEILADQPNRLAEEAATISLMGGKRYIRIRNAKDNITNALEACLEMAKLDAIILIAAGDLSKKSTLRKLADKHNMIASLACYGDDDRQCQQLLSQCERAGNFSLDDDARAYILDNLGVDRLLTRMELEKLSLYAQPEQKITFDKVKDLITASDRGEFNDVVYAFADGNAQILDKALDALLNRGQFAPIGIIRNALGHCEKLLKVKAKMAQGMDLKTAKNSLTPRIFWKYDKRFDGQISHLNHDNILTLMGILLDGEKLCKTSKMPENLICQRILHNGAAFIRSIKSKRLAS